MIPSLNLMRSLAGAIVLFVFIAAAAAHEYNLGGLKVVQPWARATPAGAMTGVGYLEIVNSGRSAMRLTGAATPAAQSVEIHTMSMDGGVMTMRPAAGVDIAPGATVKLEPGGIHLMLIGLRKALKQGEMIPLTLAFADGRSLAIELRVEAMGAMQSAHEH